MNYPDSKDAANQRLADAGAGNSTSDSGSTSSRPSAIERQMAVTARLRFGEAHREVAEDAARRKLRRFGLANGLVSFLIVFLLVVEGVSWLFTNRDRSLQTLQKAVSEVQQVVGSLVHKPVTSNNASPPATRSSSTINTPPAAASRPIDASQVAAQRKTAEVATAPALSIPITDVSVRDRPELLEQLVQIYKSKLADNPNDSSVRNALEQLQERSLSELQNIILEGDYAVAVRSMDIVARLFPEATDGVRYKYLAARLDRMQSQEKDAPAAKPTSTESAVSANTLKTAVPEPVSKPIAAEKNIPAAINSSTTSIKKATENAPSSKPEIRAVSITPGTMIEDRFVPGDEGNVFMVEISYRNFDKIAEDQSEVSLVARLGVPGDPTVLAEAPIEILGDRGTKSVVMTTLVPGNAGEKYKLNFILNGEFLSSRTVQLSRQR